MPGKRRPFGHDPWHVIARRMKMAEKIRGLLYGTYPNEAGLDTTGAVNYKTGEPLKPAAMRQKRVSYWASLVAEFVRDRSFRYWEILRECNILVENRGGPWRHDPLPTLDEDKALMILWATHMRAKRKEEGRHLKGVADHAKDKFNAMAKSQATDLILQGVCPGCAGDLPCADCDIPAMEIVPGVGLREIQA